MKKICPYCNNIIIELKGMEGLCSVCGAPLPLAAAPPPLPESEAPAEPKKEDVPAPEHRDGTDVIPEPLRNEPETDVTLLPPVRPEPDTDITLLPGGPASETNATLLPPDRSEADVTLLPPGMPERKFDITVSADMGTSYVAAAGTPISFRGWRLERQFKTRGAEADIFLVSQNETERILKLYRLDVVPKKDIMDTVMRLGQENPDRILRVLESGYDSESGRWYEIQEFIRYGSMSGLKIDPHDSVRIREVISGITESLILLHRSNIVHCDIKPSNILVRSLDPLDLVLADFGISSVLDSEVSIKMTDVKGTPMYWAPEAFSGNISTASDWWSLGTVLCEILLGKHPFEGIDKGQIILKLMQEGIDLGALDFTAPPLKEYELLLKGLLTKSYRNRWGGEEVRRWISGRRDIPTHYVYDRIAPATGKAYTINGETYDSPAELVASFASDEAKWSFGISEIYRGILEKRFLDSSRYEESNFTAGIKEKYGRDRESQNRGLFELIYELNRHLPFIYMGCVISIDNLKRLAAKSVLNEATEAEETVIDMLFSGAMRDVFERYTEITGRGDEQLKRVLESLCAMDEDDKLRRLAILGAALTPDDYFWPAGAGTTLEEKLMFLKETDADPVSLRFLEDFVFTKELLGMIVNANTYVSFNKRVEQNLYLTKADVSEAEIIDRQTIIRAAPSELVTSLPAGVKIFGLAASFFHSK